jgi:hypothetical protein
MTAKTGPTKLFRNRISGDRFLVAEKPNGDVYYAQLDEKNNPINAGNRLSREEYAAIMDNLEMELDENTVPFTFFNGEFIEKKEKSAPDAIPFK